MALLYSTDSQFHSKAHPFSLKGTDELFYSLDSFKDQKGILIVFMCNHCPYVVAVHERLSQLAREFIPQGIAVIGINSNDPAQKEADSFQNMIKTAKEWNLSFPYVFDETQEVAKAYDAVCTPDPYLYQKINGEFLLVYRGRIDDSWKDELQVKEQSLKIAMQAVLKQEAIPIEVIPSMGCSIKWKELSAK